MPLLVDNITYLSLTPTQLQEAKNSSEARGLLIKDVLLQEGDKKNQNGRIYPMNILQREAKKYESNFIAAKSSYGELDHPDSSTIRLEKTSHIIPRIYWKGNQLLGDINIITDTPSGKIAEAILSAGGRIGVSSRSVGNTKKIHNEANGDSYEEVQEDLELICWDLVSNPSVLRASFQLNEGLERNEEVIGRYERISELIKNIVS